MIQIKNLNKYYPVGSEKLHALNELDLTVEDSESVAIQGRSGAGKSTLLNILGCLDRFDSGSYLLEGVEVSTLNDGTSAKLRNSKIGFVLQDFSLVNHKTVLFNAMLPLFFNRTSSKRMEEMAMDALRQVGIEDLAKKKANQLSGGQRQRVAIARAIVNHPGMILADEPTGALDTETSTQVMTLLKELNEKGITLIVVTHDDFVADYCNRRIVIQDGKIVQDSTSLQQINS